MIRDRFPYLAKDRRLRNLGLFGVRKAFSNDLVDIFERMIETVDHIVYILCYFFECC